MARAQKGPKAAPFADARARGFVFETDALQRGLAALTGAVMRGEFPLTLIGPVGVGKATLSQHFVIAGVGPDLRAVVLPADALRVGQVAAEILLSFGHRPAADASAEEALLDFLEDTERDGRPAMVIVTGLDDAEAAIATELASLARSEADGGIGLKLVTTAVETSLGGWEVELAPMERHETRQFLEDVLATSNTGMTITAAAARAIHKLTQGFPGEAGALLDACATTAVTEGANEIDVRHIPRGEGSGPSPDDIEQALLALGAEGGSPIAKLRPTQVFPRIETGKPVAPAVAPANDKARPLDPRIIDELTRVRDGIAALQNQLDLVRREAEALSDRRGRRMERLGSATEAFAKSLRNPDFDGDQG